MSIPQILRSFTESVGLSKPRIQHTYAFHYAALQRFLQFSNASVYDIDDNAPVEDKDIQALADILADLGNPSADHLRTPTTKINTRSHYLRPNDSSFFTFVEYRTPRVNGTPETTWCTMLLVKTLTDESGIVSDPQFCMTGQYALMPEGTQAVIPMKTLCRFNQDGEDVFYGPETGAEIACCMAYTNQALMQLLSGAEINSTINQAWLLDKDDADVSGEIERMLSRDGQSFQQEIMRHQTMPSSAPVKTYATGPVI
jgi:hypothetical protein